MEAENGPNSGASGYGSDVLEHDESLYSNWHQLHGSRNVINEAGELLVDGRFRTLNSFRVIGVFIVSFINISINLRIW